MMGLMIVIRSIAGDEMAAFAPAGHATGEPGEGIWAVPSNLPRIISVASATSTYFERRR